jgi:hypothetical protein
MEGSTPNTITVMIHDPEGYLMDVPGVYPKGTVVTLDADTRAVLSVTPPEQTPSETPAPTQ